MVRSMLRLVAAADGANQGHLAVQRARRQIHCQAALIEQRRLGRKHIEVIAQPRLIALQ